MQCNYAAFSVYLSNIYIPQKNLSNDSNGN